MLALGEGQTEAIDLLLDLGADVNASDSAGFTPLHYASGAFWQENTSHVECLLGRGAEPNATDNDGRRPIDAARQKGYDGITSVLGRHGR